MRMTEMKSLADKLRASVAEPANVKSVTSGKDSRKKSTAGSNSSKPFAPEILQKILDYDTSSHKTMVHARFDAKTAKMLGHFKMATGVEHTRIAAFAVKYLFDCHPELKTLIKNYIENLEL